ncbi:long-chain fatty acid--CoA ligase [Marinibaculum pumilum]|uniref:Long-chain fatty acid--CoA ligase n=1 Tax=Marinibaculum pumilum TaxID=1766165 RepID=A0ABV7KZK3_9PROT
MTIKVYDWLAHHARRTPEKLAQHDLFSGRRFTYAEMNLRAGRLAAWLRGEGGLAQGGRAAVLSHNTTDMFDLQFACAKAGTVFVPLNWRLAVAELEFIIKDCTPEILFYSSEFSEEAQTLGKNCGLSRLVELDPQGRPDSTFEQLIAGQPEPLPHAELVHDDLLTIMFTSGTTGHPKGAMITHGMSFWNAVNLGGPAHVTTDTCHLAVLPLFHTGGLNCYANVAFHAGGTVLVMRTFDPGQALDMLLDRQGGITHFFGVPSHYQFMSLQPAFEKADFSHLTICGVGGAPCPVSVIELYGQHGVSIQQGYGMTETSPTVLVLDAADGIKRAGSTGLPALHTEVRLVDEQGRDVTRPGEIGEIWVKGPNVTPGYWNRPDANRESITDGWLHTGDAARFDEDGFYYVVDRWKDMFISGGENVYPAEVENVLSRLPQVAEAAVIGVPDEKWGEVGMAVLVLKEGAEIGEAEVLQHCGANLARYKVPKSVRLVPALPRNATGKILKRVLRDDVTAEAGAAAAS